MAALVQTIPQQSSTVPVLQTRPSSSSASFTSPSSQSSQHGSRSQTMSWNTLNAGTSSGNYRGHQVVAPYAFTSTPNLANSSSNAQNRRLWSPQLSLEHRTSSAPSVPQNPPLVGSNNYYNYNNNNNNTTTTRFAAGSVSTPSSSNSSLRSHGSKDDSAIPSRRNARNDPALRPLSTANLSLSSSFLNISSPTVSSSSKPPPDRYRRGNRRADAVAAGAQSTIVPGSLQIPPVTIDDRSSQTHPANSSGRQSPQQNASRSQGHARGASVDNTSSTEKQQPELAKRYRRRSLGTMDSASLLNLQLQMPASPQSPHPAAPSDFRIPESAIRPQSIHSQRDSSGSVNSTRSSSSSVRDAGTMEAASSASKSSKSDNSKRASRSSPLSQPVSMTPKTKTPGSSEVGAKEKKPASVVPESPASQRLAEITKNELKKPGKSRLRRAFSFGSASDLLKASSENSALKREALAAEKVRREQLKEELGAEQAAIAEQQEASGLGESIYSRQGHFFRGSTDDLSISSTASSASVMLRKMGKGMKRSTRSLVGLFRPKSLVSTSSADVAVGPMEPKLSVVNIEAEKKSVKTKKTSQNVSPGAAVFPKIDTSGLDAAKAGSSRDGSGTNKAHLRKNIVGGDKERAEVLAAVSNRKGILKKTCSDLGTSPSIRPSEGSHSRTGSDSPHSSVPSTPVDQNSRRSDNVRIAGEDYFTPDGRLSGQETRGAPISPQPVVKNIVFSPRIQFFETWPSGEYDRRADIATCNRLTPLLAQQIKEELNNFKMEMEVHEMSKIYTHFI